MQNLYVGFVSYLPGKHLLLDCLGHMMSKSIEWEDTGMTVFDNVEESATEEHDTGRLSNNQPQPE